MSRPLFARFDAFGVTVNVLRCAHVDASAPLVDAWLPPQGDESLRPVSERDLKIRGTHACFIVQLAHTTVLIDSGLQSSVLASAMQEAGISPESIDLVLLTHGDHDHIGGLMTSDGSFAFVNARIVLHGDLWEAWESAGQLGDQGAFYADEQRDFVRSLCPQIETRVQPINGSGIVAPGIRHLAAPGHRASHLAFTIETDSGCLLFMGDALVFPEILEDLSRGVSFDSDPETAIQTRRKLLQIACQSNTLSCIPHFPFPCLVEITDKTGSVCWSQWNGSNPPA